MLKRGLSLKVSDVYLRDNTFLKMRVKNIRKVRKGEKVIYTSEVRKA